MKILLTGSHGFIGSHFREYADDFEFSNWDHKIDKPISEIESYDFWGIDAVVHLAAYISVPHSYKNPLSYIHNNAYLTADLVNKAAKQGVKKFIFASSSSVYADPLSPYGASKLAAEKFLSVYKNDIDLVMLRFFNVYGEGQNREYSGVITQFMDALKKDLPLQIYGDGNQTRDFTYVRDIARILKNACETDSKYPEPLDIGKGESHSINQLAEYMGTIWGKTPKIEYLPERQEIKHSAAQKGGAKDLLINFTSLKEGLKDLYEAVNHNNNN